MEYIRSHTYLESDFSRGRVTCTFIEFRMLLDCDASGTESFRYRLQCTLYRKFSTACALGSGDTVSLGIILPAYLISEVHQL